MDSTESKCRFCAQTFRPDPRVGARQISCSAPACRAARKRESQKRWLNAHPDYFRGQYPKKRAWHDAHPGYLAQYRRTHPVAAERHRRQEQERRHRVQDRGVDIQDEIAGTQLLLFSSVTAGAAPVDIQDEIPIHRCLFLGLIGRLWGDGGRVDVQDQIDSALLACYKAGRRLQRRRTAP
jgi:hypothetical protein